MSLSLRPAIEADAEACGAICYAAFRAIATAHRFPPDFPDVETAQGLMRMMIAHPEVYSVVAEIDGRVAGSNFLWQQSSIAGVGPLTIDPEAQNAGIGRRLMEAVIERAGATSPAGVRLVQAAYHGRSLSLYTKFGFDVREPLTNMQGPAIGKVIPGHTVRKASMQDLQACNAVCQAVHGHDRAGEMRDAIANGTGSVVERDGRIVGYATLIGFFGHAVAEKTAGIKALIGAASAFEGPGLLVPTRNAELLGWCLQEGLQVVQPLSLMTRGYYQEPRGAFLPSILF